jgi:Domain of unknown function (DUF4865)
MIAKQYTINLPADYDMGIIRQRVSDRGSSFDRLPCLAFKAFLITERSQGATANRYAPFYVWHSTAGTNEFLYGDGFAHLARTFGRPVIEYWIELELRVTQRTTALQPRSATREDLPIFDHDDLADVRRREREWLARGMSDPRRLCGAVVGLDPHRWSLVRFALWHAPVDQLDPSPCEMRYEVLHLSAGQSSPSIASGLASRDSNL